MRLTVALVTAVLFHAALFGVGAALRPRAAAAPSPSAAVEIEMTEAHPLPVADAPPRAAESRPARPPRAARPHVVASVSPRATVVAPEPPEAPPIAAAPMPSRSAPSTPAIVSAPSPPRALSRAAESGGAAITAKPRYRSNPRPDYPLASLRRREEGVVLVKVAVGPDGTPSASSLAVSSGHPLLDAAALDAVRRWTFEPARAAGVPVSSLLTVPVRFSLSEPP